MIFNVALTVKRYRTIQIEAETEDEAISKVEEQYLGGEIVLDNDDIEEADYMVVP